MLQFMGSQRVRHNLATEQPKITSLSSLIMSPLFPLSNNNYHCHRSLLCVVVVVQLLSQVQLFATPWTAAHQTSLSFTISQSLLKSMCIKLVMLFNHLILCHSLLLLPSVFASISIFSSESTLHQVVKLLELQLQHQCFQ